MAIDGTEMGAATSVQVNRHAAFCMGAYTAPSSLTMYVPPRGPTVYAQASGRRGPTGVDVFSLMQGTHHTSAQPVGGSAESKGGAESAGALSTVLRLLVIFVVCQE
jgi:hypothetical protein